MNPIISAPSSIFGDTICIYRNGNRYAMKWHYHTPRDRDFFYTEGSLIRLALMPGMHSPRESILEYFGSERIAVAVLESL